MKLKKILSIFLGKVLSYGCRTKVEKPKNRAHLLPAEESDSLEEQHRQTKSEAVCNRRQMICLSNEGTNDNSE